MKPVMNGIKLPAVPVNENTSCATLKLVVSIGCVKLNVTDVTGAVAAPDGVLDAIDGNGRIKLSA